MEFATPQAEGYTIYSKSGCTYCVKAKKLLEKETPAPVIVDCDEYLLEDKEGFLKFIQNMAKKEWRTFPMIFCRGQFLGGHDDTVKFIECQKAFEETDF